MTLVINLFGGPGCGKSTTAASVFAALKRKDINCEYVSEFAKDKCWERNTKIFSDQIYILGKQHWKLFRMLGEVDAVVTDSPLLLSIVYNLLYTKMKSMDAFVLEAHNQFDNLNYVLTRTKVYNPKGRNQTEDEAKSIDVVTRNVLNQYGIPYTELDYATAADAIVADVLPRIEKAV